MIGANGQRTLKRIPGGTEVALTEPHPSQFHDSETIVRIQLFRSQHRFASPRGGSNSISRPTILHRIAMRPCQHRPCAREERICRNCCAPAAQSSATLPSRVEVVPSCSL